MLKFLSKSKKTVIFWTKHPTVNRDCLHTFNWRFTAILQQRVLNIVK
jgi:hypothetical protein